jgi:hypothetical protein
MIPSRDKHFGVSQMDRMADDLACTRCSGSGFRDTPRAHLNIPGLCFDCHGDGTRATQLKTQADRKESIRREKLRQQRCAPIEQKVWNTRNTNRVAHDLHIVRWPIVKEMGQFTTQEYADKCGITKTQAWIELCCNNKVYVNWSQDFEPVGWTIAT